MGIEKIYQLPKIFYKAIENTVEHDGVEHAGYLSFLLMLAIFPFLVFFTAIIGTISKALGVPIVETLTDMILNSPWANFIDALKPRILEIAAVPPQSFLTIAIISAIWTASSIFEAIRTTLNKAYNIKKPPAYILRRLFSIIEFIIVIVVIAVILLTLIIMPTLWRLVEEYIHISNNYMLQIIDGGNAYIRSLILYTFGLLFVSYLYYFLPNKKQSFFSTLPGTFLVLILWSCFSKIFQYYISYFPQINIIYGSIAGIIISLLYFYICSLILIFGAEFNQLFDSYYKK